MKLMEVDEAASAIKSLVDEDADIIWGSAFVPELDGKIRVSVVATGIGAASLLAAAPTTLSDLDTAAAPPRPAVAAPVARPMPVLKAVPATAPVAPPAAKFTPVVVPISEAELRLTPPASSLPAPMFEEGFQDELVLDNERLIVLTPPADAETELTLVDPFGEPMRGPSLFDRMAMAARAAVHVDTIELPVEALRPRRRLMFGGASR
jgi:cell division protein FtsZ